MQESVLSDVTLPNIPCTTVDEQLQPNMTTIGVTQGSSHLIILNPISLVLL